MSNAVYTAFEASEAAEMPIGTNIHFTGGGLIRPVEGEERPHGRVVKKAKFMFSGCEWADCQQGNRADWCDESCPCEDWHDTEHCDCETKERAAWADGRTYCVQLF